MQWAQLQLANTTIAVHSCISSAPQHFPVLILMNWISLSVPQLSPKIFPVQIHSNICTNPRPQPPSYWKKFYFFMFIAVSRIICTWATLQRKYINDDTIYIHHRQKTPTGPGLSTHVAFSYIFSSAWLCQQSSWNRNSSIVRLWHRLSLKLLHGFLSNFSCGFPWAICPDGLFVFEKKIKILNFYEYFSFSLTWDPIGAKLQNATPPSNYCVDSLFPHCPACRF